MSYFVTLDLLLIVTTAIAFWLERSTPHLRAAPAGKGSVTDGAKRQSRQASRPVSPTPTTDPVTRLPARRVVFERFHTLLKQAHSRGTPFGIVLVGVDDFARLSDQIGKDSGNRLLANLARRLVAVTRGAEMVGYMRGQDFAVLMPNPKDAKALDRMVSKLRAAAETPFPLPGIDQSISPTIRFGQALYRQDGDDWTSILTAADHSLLAPEPAPEATNRTDEQQVPAEIRESLTTLGLTWPITEEAVKRRYKELAKRNHPDANGGRRDCEERLKTINLAYAAIRSVLDRAPKQAFASSFA
jgi:diguanylate cyclase (GGDEF)-like protein